VNGERALGVSKLQVDVVGDLGKLGGLVELSESSRE
jgi:hypothetical protein